MTDRDEETTHAATPTEARRQMPEVTETVECRCPQCGRLHKSLGFGAPPAFAQLMKFYAVSTIAELIAAQEHHIAKLQSRLPEPREPIAIRRIREG